MATNNLKVEELRAQLAHRGLSVAGIKPILVRRLEAALRDESEESLDSKSDLNTSRKRRRESNDKDGDSEAPQKIKAIDELRSMNVKQLREEASNRGVSTSGTKKELLERLCASDSNNSSDNGQDDSKEENANSHAPQKVTDIDSLRAMNIKQLREEAVTRGISAAGTKKELLERLCADNDNVPSNNNDSVKEKKEKIVTATRKGSAVLDKCLPDHIKMQYHVLQVGDEIYDAMLNQTNVMENNNKFFVLQVLESDDGGKFMVYFRWGRVGVKGQDKLNGPYTSQQAAISEFEKKFFDKTKNRWFNRKDFYSHPRSYTWLEMDYSETKNERTVQLKPESTLTLETKESKLEARIAKFISLICNMSMMRQQMMEIGYNAEKLPLGKLSKSTILNLDFLLGLAGLFASSNGPKFISSVRLDLGEAAKAAICDLLNCNLVSASPASSFSIKLYLIYESMNDIDSLPLDKATIEMYGYGVLKRIADVISQADRKTLEQLSGEFYTVIPHDFGFKKTSLFVIDTPQKLKNKLEMVGALGEIEVAMKLIGDDTDMEDPLYCQYRRLHCDLVPLEVHSEEFSMIQKYTRNTHAKTHSNYDVDIIQIFKVSREGEAEKFEKFAGTKNRMLLWHGSRLTNWTGILSQVCHLILEENMIRLKPYQVCALLLPKHPSQVTCLAKEFILLICSQKVLIIVVQPKVPMLVCCFYVSVALGDMAELLTANYQADKLPAGKLSTKGVGSTAPDLSEAATLENGVVVPLGRPKEQPGPKGALCYNEYIVYNVEQIRMRYIVNVNFNFK
ncbi:Poly [ADP-ribose] polymerase 2 [Orobanche minor]